MTARKFMWLLALVSCSSLPKGAKIQIDDKTLNPSQLPFTQHANYMALDIPFQPVKSVHGELETREGVKLISRGEAHVTIITPPEFDVLSKKMTIEDLNALAEKLKVQESDVHAVCVGEGHAKLDGREERTYFIVVDSKKLAAIRAEIERVFKERGGAPEAFRASDFFPHITVGFTKSDLHIQNGVIKDRRSCRY